MRQWQWHNYCLLLAMKNRIIIYLLTIGIAVIVLLQCSGCSGVTKITDAITNLSARQVYAREFKEAPTVYTNWETAFEAAKNDSLQISLPYGERGTFAPSQNRVYSYTVDVQDGELLEVAITKDSVERVFMDILEPSGTGWKNLKSAGLNDSSITISPLKSTVLKVIIQPEINASGSFLIEINKKPLFIFPVAGKGNNDIGSFWGVDRDGGARRHEGIDIFAKKGTPVVAATDGRIGYTGEKGLGGKQVWLRASGLGSSLYYAHLDSIAVASGSQVRTGDTLGFVGNTGNARFTPPHLHFGIYKGYSGAVNPLAYVFKTKTTLGTDYPSAFSAIQVAVKSTANVRQGPSTSFTVLGQLSANDRVTLLGQHKDWLHIITPLGQKAFLHTSLAKSYN